MGFPDTYPHNVSHNISSDESSDNYDDSYYDIPRSPELKAIRLKSQPDNVKRNHDDYVSDSEEELDIDSPWLSDLRSKPRNHWERKRRRRDDDDGDPGTARWGEGKSKRRADRLLIDTMDSNLMWKVDSKVLFDPLPGEGVITFDQPGRPTRRPKTRKRVFLPLVVPGKKGSVEVMACPDTGSDHNIISLELAQDIGLQLVKVEEQNDFRLANGKRVMAIGQAFLQYAFGAGKATDPIDLTGLECITVYVFQTLIEPALLGAAFLSEAEIYTKNKHRLIEEEISPGSAFQVNAVGIPQRGLVCMLDTSVTYATADTGSDVDLVSPQFVEERGFEIEASYHELQFADGSKAITSGIIRASFVIGNLDLYQRFRPCDADTLYLEFFILEGLKSNVLIGQDTLEELEVLERHNDSFVQFLPQVGESDCNPIRLIGRKEGKLASTLSCVKNWLKPNKQSETGLSGINDEKEEEERLLNIQRENARLETIEESGSTSQTIKNDNAPRYSTPERGLAPMSPATTSGRVLFECKSSGCTAEPFQTQYLLNCHSNVHSTLWPHYCPVAGCPRSEGGRGFTRKSEMIRHGLVHDSPGYVCPFCPDREHIYPLPDNLQRHVRVHHVDKSVDDPQLCDVLAQRPDGPSRGRRRRGPPTST